MKKTRYKLVEVGDPAPVRLCARCDKVLMVPAWKHCEPCEKHLRRVRTLLHWRGYTSRTYDAASFCIDKDKPHIIGVSKDGNVAIWG